MVEVLGGALEALPPIIQQEYSNGTTTSTISVAPSSWCQRYYYLPPRQRIGRIVQVARIAKKLTYKTLSTQTGISQADLLAIEQGRLAVSDEEAYTLARMLGVEECHLKEPLEYVP